MRSAFAIAFPKPLPLACSLYGLRENPSRAFLGPVSCPSGFHSLGPLGRPVHNEPSEFTRRAILRYAWRAERKPNDQTRSLFAALMGSFTETLSQCHVCSLCTFHFAQVWGGIGSGGGGRASGAAGLESGAGFSVSGSGETTIFGGLCSIEAGKTDELEEDGVSEWPQVEGW